MDLNSKREYLGNMTANKIGFYLFIAVFNLFATLAAIANSPITVSCNGTAYQTEIKLSGHFYLSKGLMSVDQRSEQIDEAIKLQLRYASGYFYNTEDPKSPKMIIREVDLKIHSKSLKEAPYPIAIEVDSLHHPKYETDNPYQVEAQKVGKVAKGSPAYEVSFVVSAPAIACFGSAQFKAELNLPLPVDPFLGYWLVRPQDRREIKWRESQWRINPCGAREIADLPHPYYYWYFWDPYRKGQDMNEVSFNCDELINPKTQLVNSTLKLERAEKLANPRAQAQPLAWFEVKRAMVMFGILDAKFPRLEPNLLFRILPKWWLDQKLESFSIENAKTFDRGTLAFVLFVKKLKSFIEIDSIHTPFFTTSKAFDLEIEGRSKHTGKKIELRVFYGETDYLTHPVTEYLRVLYEELSKSDLVIYNGHSGLGSNISLNTMQDALELSGQTISKAITTKANQVFGFFSCYTYAYFGKEILDERAKTHMPTQAFFTGAELGDERASLDLLKSFDEKRLALLPEDHPESKPQDFLISITK